MSRNKTTPRRLCQVLPWLCLPALGCATAPPRQNSVAADRIIAVLRAKNAGDARRIEELENQGFVLDDQLDSRRLASEQRAPATLPPVAPQAAAPQRPAPVAPAAPADEPSSVVAERDVEYAGATAKASTHAPSSHRPMLRLGAAPEPVESRAGGAPGGARRPGRQARRGL